MEGETSCVCISLKVGGNVQAVVGHIHVETIRRHAEAIHARKTSDGLEAHEAADSVRCNRQFEGHGASDASVEFGKVEDDLLSSIVPTVRRDTTNEYYGDRWIGDDVTAAEESASAVTGSLARAVNIFDAY